MSTSRKHEWGQWWQTRFDLYRQVRSQVAILLGGQNEVYAYEKEYSRAFKKKGRAINKQKLIDTLCRADFVFMSDFHALAQSQKTHLRILRSLPKTTNLVLAVECFESRSQKWIDLWLANKISTKDLLLKSQWHSHWGFPWSHYEPIFLWAKKNKIPVYGINKFYKKRSAESLKKRDQWAARQVKQIVQQHPAYKFFIIFGDWHLAPAHLPFELRQQMPKLKKSRIFTIYQNVEKIYFDLLKKNKESQAEVVLLNPNSACVLSVAPWVKWYNYLLYLESLYDLELEDEGLDFTDHVSSFVKLLCHEFKIKLNQDNLAVCSAEEGAFYTQISSILSKQELSLAKKMISAGQSFYVPQLSLGFLAQPTVNHAAQLAGEYIHAELSGRKRLYWKMPEDFLLQIWIQAISYLATKIINPKRKTDSLADLQLSLKHTGLNSHRSEALRIALEQKFRESLLAHDLVKKKQISKARHKSSYFVAARLLGGIMGERLYNGIRQGTLKADWVKKSMQYSLEATGFENFYAETVEVADDLPFIFKSKQERL